ncbi:serine/threonine kinase [Leptolyngbya sp. NIES-3755]|nr:serine/threonine kinase [Leptolyngbya sp. NIES-3755]
MTQESTTEPKTLEGKVLSGLRGHYAIVSLAENQPGVRLYNGTDLATDSPVLVKEYYSFWWTAVEMQQMEAAIRPLETIELHSGGVQDFRLLIPQDMFVSVKDQRCYLVLRSPHHPGQSLKHYLETQGSLSTTTVRHFLSQVLQSLWFLQGQMIDFADGETQKGTAHGNLTLESLLIVPESQAWTDQFQVYLRDFALWESVVKPEMLSSRSLNEQKQQDLKDLGTIATQMLFGELNPPSYWNPIQDPRWSTIADQFLKQFIQQLLGIEAPPFSGAKAARNQLLTLPTIEEPQATETNTEWESIELGQADRPPLYFKIAFAVAILGLVANLGLLWINKGAMPPPKFNFIQHRK